MRGREYWNERYVSNDWLDSLQIGEWNWTNGFSWFTIPILNHNGEAQFLKLKKTPWGSDSQPRALTNPDGSRMALWPFPYLENRIQQEEETIFLCEGEGDTLAALSQGLLAVSATHGAGNWCDKFKLCFRQDITVVCAYDIDDAGEKGYRKLQAWFKDHMPSVRFVRFPFPDEFNGKDLTDYFLWMTTKR